jgi:hypothetical protein
MGVKMMEKTNPPVTTAAAQRRCPAWPNVPVALAVVVAIALVAAIAFSLTVVLAGHPVDQASGIIWAR